MNNLWWNQSLLYRVNDFGDPYPHPKYHGWFYHIDEINVFDKGWERFRFTFNGTFQKHSFVKWMDEISPLGASHFLSYAVSEGAAKCQNGK